MEARSKEQTYHHNQMVQYISSKYNASAWEHHDDFGG
jgi:hypothetical protein